MGNLRHWNRFADIDPKFTKPITGKSYKGTSPNPQYVIRCLTEIFGPVGEGFGWDVVAEDFVPLSDETLHWCRIRFWHTDRANAFDSYGQTKAVSIVKRGTPQEYAMVDEDAPKKSLTDAIIKAASQIGIAANIFLGRWDDQKYVAQVNAEFRAEESQNPTQQLVQAIYDAARDGLPKNASPDEIAEAFANAICDDFKRKGLKALDSAWNKHEPMINRIGAKYEILRDRIVDAYETRKNELTEPAPINGKGHPALAGDAIPY